MGTFPPQPNRWAMEFYYPNRTNDFWRVMGIIYYDDPAHFYTPDGKGFKLDEIKALLEREGIALHDTGARVRRLKDNASDKFLEIVTPVDLGALLKRMPHCTHIATTGQKAAEVLAAITHSAVPAMGETVTAVWRDDGRTLHITRLPSTSRAYPLSPLKKAEAYRKWLTGDKR